MEKRKYSVFLGNVGSCSDRYCPAYGKDYSTNELLDRVESIDLVSGVDLVATPNLMKNRKSLMESLKNRDLEVVSIAADIFTEEKWKKGSLSSTDPSIRKEAIRHSKEVIDLTEESGSDIFTIWPGQDGYDYIFQTDYIKSRQYFIDSLAELCEYNPNMTVALEYKMKEPRTHSYLNTVGTTLLMAQATGYNNCKLIIDYGHALLGYENPAESVAILHQFGNRLAHIHINDNYRYWDDDMIVGTVRTHEFLEFFYWLRKIGYDGWITIDQFPYREDGKQAVEESAVWLNYLESLIESADFNEIEETLSSGDGVLSSRLMRKIISKDWK